MIKNVFEQSKVDLFETFCNEAKNIVIVTHVSPDGDAIGSSLGLAQFLVQRGKFVHIIVPNSFPAFLCWLKGANEIIVYDKNIEKADSIIEKSDLICCLDFNSIKRIDKMEEVIGKSLARKVMLDHHLFPDSFCNLTMSYPELTSTSEGIFRLIYRMNGYDNITKEGAEAIYVGMMTDTGGFTYNSNTPDLYFIIIQLLAKGIDKDDIYRKVYNTYSEERLRMMGFVLYEKMQVFHEFGSALITLTNKELDKFKYVKGDTEGFVNIPLSIKDVCFSTFMREDTQKNMIKISLRSVGDFPCNQVASEFFNGGGHKNASGGEVYGTMEDAIELYKRALIKFEDLLVNKK